MSNKKLGDAAKKANRAVGEAIQLLQELQGFLGRTNSLGIAAGFSVAADTVNELRIKLKAKSDELSALKRRDRLSIAAAIHEATEKELLYRRKQEEVCFNCASWSADFPRDAKKTALCLGIDLAAQPNQRRRLAVDKSSQHRKTAKEYGLVTPSGFSCRLWRQDRS